MNARIKANFQITEWNQTIYDHPTDASPLIQAKVRRRFTGALTGESTAELLMCSPTDSDAGYVGAERIIGELEGRQGSFVIQHGGRVEDGAAYPFGFIIPGSGTGKLQGLRGTALLEVTETGEHTITLDYTLPKVNESKSD